MRFFNKRPQKGMPISIKGFAKAIHAMAYALENIEVANGHVEWTAFGAPRIFVDQSNDLTPVGDSTNVALKWYDTNNTWKPVLPVYATNDEESGDLAEGDRVVTGVQTSPDDGSLLQLVTKPLPAMGGGGGSVPDGDSTHLILKWDTTTSAWIAGAYTEKTYNFVTDEGIIPMTVMAKAVGSAVDSWTTADVRKLLQVNSSGVLRIDKGYLVS